MKRPDFSDVLKEDRLFFDGAMGTSIQQYNLGPDDYQGREGCPEILNLSRPQLIQGIHEQYYRAGCNVVETNTFGSSELVLGEYGLEADAYRLSKIGAELAREVAAGFQDPAIPRYVAGSMGPGLKLPSLRHITPDSVARAYLPQIRGLMDGGADILIIETAQDMLHAKTLLSVVLKEFKSRGRLLPVILSVTIEKSGTMLVGSDISTVIHTFRNYPLTALGINCATGPQDMADAVRTLHEQSPFPAFVMPNAGFPHTVDDHFVYDLNPEQFARQMHDYLRRYDLNIVGGCCGTTPEHLHHLIQGAPALHHPLMHESRNPEYSVTSLYSAQPLNVTPPPLLIGERTNATGSKKFREALLADDFEAMAGIAASQIAEGAHVLDVNVAWVGRDEVADMREFICRLNTASTIPLQIDSTNPDVMEAALQNTAGKCILNSVNLEEGEERFDRIAGLASRYGASLIMLTIDEEGMAKRCEDKLRIARRMIRRAVELHGLPIQDCLIDPLTFTLASGDEDSRGLAMETLKAIRNLKSEFPGLKLLLGLSNISFGLKPKARHVLNSVMMDEAVKQGLDAAIVHAGRIIPLHKIPDELQSRALDLIYDRQHGPSLSPLLCFIQAFEDHAVTDSEEEEISLSLEEGLKKSVIDGTRKRILPLLEQALEIYAPFNIINEFLLPGMEEVGRLFGAGKMQLPFVLQAAETMKIAVSHLEPHMEKQENGNRGSLLLATVKGDVHDIGKNLVDIVVSNNGFDVFNIGIKQSIENILAGVETYNPDVIGLSGLLVKSVQVMKEYLEIFRDRGMTIPVILGGAALTRKYVENELRQIYPGPLYYAADAFKGLDLMKRISSRSHEALMADMTALRPAVTPAAASATGTLRALQTPPASFAVPAPDHPPLLRRGNPDPDDVLPFMDFKALFRGQWRLKRLDDWSDDEYEAFLKKEGRDVFDALMNETEVRALFDLKYAYTYVYCLADGDTLQLFRNQNDTEPCCSWDFRRQKGGGLAIPDYFRTSADAVKDILPLQVVTSGSRIVPYLSHNYEDHEYKRYLYLHGIFAEMTEALAEYVHGLIRKDLGFSGEDSKRSRRYSFGYPACPDLEQQRELLAILQADSMGLSLSEEDQIVPEFSTSAFIVHHPEAKYFSV